MVKCKDGPYVCHEQHAEIVAALAADKQAADRATFDAIRAFTVLKDEVAALQAEVERYRLASLRGDIALCENAHLKADNSRLRAAGDEMENAIRSFDSTKPHYHSRMKLTEKEYNAVKAWLDAKGVQP